MKTSRRLHPLAFILAFTIGIAACSDSPTDGSSSEATGNLLPTSIGSTWEYTDDSGVNTTEIIAVGDTVLNGATYTEFKETYGSSRFIRREGNTWYEWKEAHPENPLPILKTGAAGRTWEHSYDDFYLFTTTNESTFTIATVDTTLTFNGEDYDNVMVVTYSRVQKANGIQVREELMGTYYYRADIGLVQYIPGKGSLFADEMYLKSHSIK